jgi:hypothetical protein
MEGRLQPLRSFSYVGGTADQTDTRGSFRREYHDESRMVSRRPLSKRDTDRVHNVCADRDGPNPAPAAGILDTLPADVTFVSASQGCTPIAGKVDCVLGTLAPNASGTVEIVVTPRRTGTLTNTAVVGSAVTDANWSNNTATIATTVMK